MNVFYVGTPRVCTLLCTCGVCPQLENILMSAEGVAKITDFGLSVLDHPDRLLSSNAGSLCYLAPEVLQGGTYRGTGALVLKPFLLWS